MTAVATEQPLLRVVLDGEIVAEANLVIHDPARAWEAFQEAFPTLAEGVVGELFNTMRVACHPALLAERGPQGIHINLLSGVPYGEAHN